MTKKTTLGLALILIRVIPTTSLSAYATIGPDAPQDGKQYTINGIVSSQYSALFKKWSAEYSGMYQGVKTKYSSVGISNVAYQYSKKSTSFEITDVPLAAKQF